MNISQRLRTCAKHTGLDAVIELLNEAADEIDALQARAQVLGECEPVAWCIEAQVADEWVVQYPIRFTKQDAELDASRYMPGPVLRIRPLAFGDTTPQPAQATQAEVTDDLVEKARVETFQKTGADLIPEVAATFARAILALRPVQVPMTPLTDAQMEKGRDQIFSINNPYCPCDRKTFKKVAQWVERHHQIGITAQIKKEVP